MIISEVNHRVDLKSNNSHRATLCCLKKVLKMCKSTVFFFFDTKGIHKRRGIWIGQLSLLVNATESWRPACHY